MPRRGCDDESGCGYRRAGDTERGGDGDADRVGVTAMRNEGEMMEMQNTSETETQIAGVGNNG